MQISPGTTVGRYTVEEMVGEGGMATVYRVRHNELHATYALKVLNLVSESIQRRLVQEGRVQARLRHPNILPVTDILDVGGRPGLIMEYVDGPSLEIHLATRRLSHAEADRLARGILSAVAYAHGQGVVHRDLKPANILLADIGDEYLPKVADFGLVKLLGEENDSLHKTRSGIGIGTPCYMAPEQALDAAHVDERADVFSLGAILYELACGRRAFHGPNAVAIILRIAAGEYTPPEEVDPELPVRFVEAIKGALQTDRKRRIQDLPTLRAVWQGERSFIAAEPTPGDATWGDHDALAAADGGLSDLQDLIRSIAEKPDREVQRPAAAPVASVEQGGSPATAVPVSPTIGPPPRLPPLRIDPLLASRPELSRPEPADAAEGTLADDLALDLGAGADSVSDGLLSVEPTGGRVAPAPVEAIAFDMAVRGGESEADVTEEPGSSRLLPRLALLAGLVSVLAVGGILVVAWALVGPRSTEPEQASTLAEEASILAEVIAVPAPQPEPEEPAEALASVPGASVEPLASRPAEPTASERTPEPVKTPAAEAAAPAPHPAPTSTPVAAPQTPRVGTVEVSGDMVSVVLISQNGRRHVPGKVPIGTYDLEVSFPNGKTVTRNEMVRVTDGATVSIRCSSRIENCR